MPTKNGNKNGQCNRECCKGCCKRFATAAAYSGANFLCIFAFTLSLTYIFQKLMSVEYLHQNLLYMDGPGFGPVAPVAYCVKNGRRRYCSEIKLGAVALDKCECNGNDYAATLFLEILNQKKLNDSLATAQFNGSTAALDKAQAAKDIQTVIDRCVPGGLKNLVKNTSNGIICYLLALFRVIGWRPQVEFDLNGRASDDVEGKIESELKRSDANNTMRENETKHSILLWALVIRDEIHKGWTYPEAVAIANRVLALPDDTDLFRISRRSLEEILYTNESIKEMDFSMDKYKRYTPLANRTDYELLNYLPVICTVHYHEMNMSVNVQVFPSAGIFAPNFQVFNANPDTFIDSLVGFMLPTSTFGKATVMCTAMAANINYLTSESGNAKIRMQYYA